MEYERSRRANTVAALEARQRSPDGKTDRLLGAELAAARESLLIAERSLKSVLAVQQELTAAERRAVTNLDSVISAARADLQGRLRSLHRYVSSDIESGGHGSSNSTASSITLSNDLADEREMQDVELSNVDYSDNPIAGSFEKGGAKLADYRWAVETWETVVRPGVNRGMSRDDFAQRDRERGASPFRRTADVHDLFLGDSDRILLSRRSDGRFDVVNGRHRVHVARQLGIKSLPARIVG
jgi:hypothetical protein